MHIRIVRAFALPDPISGDLIQAQPGRAGIVLTLAEIEAQIGKTFAT